MRIAQYEVWEPIGRDGAAEIFRARDLRLERDVAIKLLRPDEVARPGAVDRFRREARLASLVSHPHVCAVHDSGEHDGLPYLVCELLEGRALDETTGNRPLPPAQALEIAIQIADALSAAHRRGLVHGNLKPSNVFITTDGHVKLLELGGAAAAIEAKADAAASDAPTATIDAARTTSVEALVVPPDAREEPFHPYMSPEGVAGATLDGRSDLFSTGALLYEMLTGRRAFAGDTPAQVAAAIVGKEPPRPRAIARRVPRRVEAIVLKALAKDPAARYATAMELRDDLRRVRRAIDAPDRPAAARRPAWIAGAALVAILVLGAAVAWSRWGPEDGGAATVERRAILVSQIANGTGDPDFDGTLREAVSVYLGQSPYLELVSDDRIRGALQLMGREPDRPMTHEVAMEVCQRLGLQALIEGSVSAVGPSTILALVASDCAAGTTILREQVEVDRKEGVLRALGELTESVRRSLGESGASLARHNVPIEEATTPSLEALRAYTEGAARRAAGAEMAAIEPLRRAIALDPRFALAYTTLSTLYGGLGETGRSEEYARLAYEHREHVSERERLFITYQYHDRFTGDQLQARDALEVWKRTYPRDYRPANALALLLLRLGDYDGAAAEAEEAIRRNPDHAFPHSNLAYAHRGAGRYAEARAVAERAIARGIETVPLRRLLYQLAELQQDDRTARAQLEWAAGNRRGFDVLGARAQVLAFRGDMAAARPLYEETVRAAADAGLEQVASGYAAAAALTEALYGYRAEAAALARSVLRSATAYEPQLRAATALALAGVPDEAEAVVRRLRPLRPEDTLLHAAYLPAAQAAVHLARGEAAEAVAALRPAAGYERGIVAALLPACVRGIAELQAGNPGAAAREFRSVLESRGADPFSAALPAAELGLARALAREGDTGRSREMYGALLARWNGAAADLPLLAAARDELARLP